MANPENISPQDTPEFAAWLAWYMRAQQRRLTPVNTIAAWSDICGVGNLLAACDWNLETLHANGAFSALSRVYIVLGKPYFVDVAPAPSERVLVINDGIARVLDVPDLSYTDDTQVIWYCRDLLMNHYLALMSLVQQGLGLRTVLAGGERCQYTTPKVTGHSMLHYTGTPSEWGQKLLSQ